MENNMWKKGLVLGIIFLFVGASVVPSAGTLEESSRATMGRAILYVGGSGPGNYSTIQSAIDVASSGDTVFVYNGTYHEHITVSKSYLNLLGENKETTIIDADGYGQGVDGAGVSIPEYCHYNFVSGFTVMNTTYVGIMIHADTAHSGATANYNTISDCIVRDCTGVGGIRILGHRWTCHADYNTVINCEVFNISGTGVLIQGGQGYAYYNKIINTTSYNNTVGIHVGGFQTDGSIISNCETFNNTEYGLTIVSSDTTVYHNNLINNGQNAYDEGTNTWYNASLQEGNYFDDYNGTDTNGDGIGDTPYSIPGGSNQDLYPLMYPWYPSHHDTVWVDDSYNSSTPGWGYDRFNRIQYGVNEVEGSTVYVYNGMYYENVVVDKTINLIGEDKNTTFINGSSGTEITINITANSVNLSGFAIENIWAYGDVGIWIYSNNNIISGNILLGHGDDGITVFGNNNTISENVFEDNADGIGLGDYCSNNTVYGNIINNCTDDGIYGGNNNIISANIIDNNADSGIWLRNKSNNYISGNTIINNYRGVSLKENSKDNTISGNIISQNYRDGIDLQNSNNNSIIGNSISSNNEGIELGYSSNSNTISFNTIFDNWDGIEVHYSCDNNIIQDNNISSNSDDGIDINWSSTDNIIVRNTISNNQVGIHLSDFSDNNSIYHNNLINNTMNAYDKCSNTWDNGYPSGGNHWSDYFGDDFYSGPNQNIPGRDGIGDTPYNISGGDNQDMYPCMEPDGWINSPPNVPDRPSGEVIILPGVAYTYTTSTIDPDDDSIWFKWDWGDGTFSDWLGPYDSGEEASESHIWSQGTYEVTVKAKDSRNPETDWSAPLTVNAIFPNLKTVFLFGFITNLSKSTDYYSFNVVKLLWIGFNPISPEILSSNEVIVISDKFFGILRPSFIFGFFKAMVLT